MCRPASRAHAREARRPTRARARDTGPGEGAVRPDGLERRSSGRQTAKVSGGLHQSTSHHVPAEPTSTASSVRVGLQKIDGAGLLTCSTRSDNENSTVRSSESPMKHQVSSHCGEVLLVTQAVDGPMSTERRRGVHHRAIVLGGQRFPGVKCCACQMKLSGTISTSSSSSSTDHSASGGIVIR
jgi:hypothetical protein